MPFALSLGFFAILLGSPNVEPLPGVKTGGVPSENIQALSALLGQGVCPCDQKRTILMCVQQKDCPAATELAQFGVERFREGLSVSQVGEEVIKRYIEQHVRYTFTIDGSPSKGAANAAVKIVEFADFECPHCSLMRTVLGEVAKKYPKDVAVIFKQFPLPHHRYAADASRAALAAHRQGKFWEMHDLIFDNQGKLAADSFGKFAAQLGLDKTRFATDMKSEQIQSEIERDKREAIEAQIQGTPALYINGRMFTDEMTPEKIGAFVERLLKETAK